jgi:hypothetical protein
MMLLQPRPVGLGSGRRLQTSRQHLTPRCIATTPPRTASTGKHTTIRQQLPPLQDVSITGPRVTRRTHARCVGWAAGVPQQPARVTRPPRRNALLICLNAHWMPTKSVRRSVGQLRARWRRRPCTLDSSRHLQPALSQRGAAAAWPRLGRPLSPTPPSISTPTHLTPPESYVMTFKQLCADAPRQHTQNRRSNSMPALPTRGIRQPPPSLPPSPMH